MATDLDVEEELPLTGSTNLLPSLQSSASRCAVPSSRVLLAAGSVAWPDGTGSSVENEIKEWNKMIYNIFERIQQ